MSMQIGSRLTVMFAMIVWENMKERSFKKKQRRYTMNWHRCDMCGCYLDPGEGLLCDECLEKRRKREESRNAFSNLTVGNYGQMEMSLKGGMQLWQD